MTINVKISGSVGSECDLTEYLIDGFQEPIASPTATKFTLHDTDTGDNPFGVALDLIVTGTGFTYSGGELTGGTITKIEIKALPPGPNAVISTITGLNLDAKALSDAALNNPGALPAMLFDVDSFAYTGGDGPDTFTGGALNDTISGGKGNDTLAGDEGDDTIDGGGGDDLLDGGEGNDTIDGGDGNDTVTGGDNNDAIFGGAGNDTINGEDGDDVIEGGAGSDQLNGGGGSNDTLSNASDTAGVTVDLGVGTALGGDAAGDDFVGFENIRGGSGDDILTGDTNANVIEGGAGADTIDGFGGKDTLSYQHDTKGVSVNLETQIVSGGDAEGDSILTNFFNVIGGSGDDDLTGDDGVNVIEGGAGADKLTGFGSGDTLSYEHDTAGVTVDLEFGTAKGGDAEGDKFSNFSNLRGGLGNDSFDGNDTLNTIEGGAGNDLLNGQASNDLLFGQDGDDVLNGGGDDDTLDGGDGNDTLLGGAGKDALTGGKGEDTASYAGSSAGVTVNLGTDKFTGGDAAGDTWNGDIENLIGSGKGDNLTGDEFVNKIDGGDGDDTIHGGDEDDHILGGKGFDQIFGDAGADVLDPGDSDADDDIHGEGDAFDTVDYSKASSNITIDLSVVANPGPHASGRGAAEGDWLFEIEHVIGTDFDDTLIGGDKVMAGVFSPDNALDGGKGDDTISGLGGHDDLDGGDGNDTVDGGEGNDLIHGAAGNDTLNGGAGDDFVVGGAGADIADGGEGNDLISYFGSKAGVTLTLGAGGKEGKGAGAGSDALGDKFANFESIVGGDGNDVLTGNELANVLAGNGGIDKLKGMAGDDSLTGGDGNDTLDGGDGNDLLDGGEGNDTLIGGAGIDTVSYASSKNGLTAVLGKDGTLTGATNTDGDKITLVENLIGTAKNDSLGGNNKDNVIEGGDGSDALNGGGGNDTVSYASAGAAVTVDLSQIISQDTGGAGTDQIAEFENILGSAHDDKLNGDTKDNVIDGGAGKDTIDGGDGNDTLLGGDGNDTIGGGADNDTLEGGAGSDDLNGGSGINTLSYASDTAGVTVNLQTGSVGGGHAGGDDLLVASFQNLTGGSGNDVLTGSAVDNLIRGGAGDDTLVGGLAGDAADDTLDGGTGNDLLSGVGATFLIGGDGNDTASYAQDDDGITIALAAKGGKSTGTGGFADGDELTGIENIIGGDGDDKLTGNELANVFEGGDGADTLNGGANPATDGDWASYAGDTTGVTVDLSKQDGIAAQTGGDAAGDKLKNFENVRGGSKADKLTGSAGNNVIEGGDGNDVLDGGAGNDTISFAGATGDISFQLGAFDAKTGNSVESTAVIGGVADDKAQNFENIIGSAKNDELIGNETANRIDGGIGADTLVGGAGNDVLEGGDGHDELEGNAGNDSLQGGDGNDDLFGGPGGDNMDGGAGIDTLIYETTVEHLNIDLVKSTVASTIFNKSSPELVEGTGDKIAGFENVHSGEGNDTINGTAAANQLLGRGGDDKLIGGAGDDTLTGDVGDDLIEGGAGLDNLDGGDGSNDTLSYAGSTGLVVVDLGKSKVIFDPRFRSDADGDTIAGFENITGSNFADRLTGSDGVNRIDGGVGDDTLVGGKDADIVIGGEGEDIGVFGGLLGGTTVDLSTQSTIDKNGNLVGGATAKGQDAEGDKLAGLEHLVGGFGGEQFTGDAKNNVLLGLGGDDIIDGGAGNDAIAGRIFAYSSENGKFFFSLLLTDNTVKTNSFSVSGDTGNDTVFGGSGNDLVMGDNATVGDKLDGGTGIDTLTYGNSDAGVSVDLSQQDTDNANKAFDAGTKQTGGDAAGDLLAGFENLTGSSHDDALFGDGNVNVIDGGAGNDEVEGGANNDTINGGDGNDELFGDDGADVINGDDGDDEVYGGLGADKMDGGDGIDTLEYGITGPGNITVDLSKNKVTVSGKDPASLAEAKGDTIKNFENVTTDDGNDVIIGDAFANVLDGAAGNDTIKGGGGNDILLGDDGDDLLEGGAGADDLDGGNDGNDTATYAASAAGVTVDLKNGIGKGGDAEGDTLTGFAHIIGSAKNDVLIGNDGDDGVNRYDGGAGDDIIVVEGNSEMAFGGAGNDTLSFAGVTGDVTADLSDQGKADTLRQKITGGEGNTGKVAVGVDATEFENLTGSDHNDKLTGDAKNNVIEGGKGADTIIGGGGIDTLSYASDTTGVTVTVGVEVSVGDADGDTVTWTGFQNVLGGAGNDLVQGDDLANILTGGDGNDFLHGGKGNDTLNGGDGDDQMLGGEGNDIIDGGDGDDIVNGFGGGEGNDAINGGNGNDTLNGVEGKDTINGGAGDDTVTGGLAGDAMDGGDGKDTLHYDAEINLTINLTTNKVSAKGEVKGFSDEGTGDTIKNFENISTDDGNDILTGNAAANILESHGGDDFLDGAGGADILKGGANEDTYFVDELDTVIELAGEGDSDLVEAGFSYVLSNAVDQEIEDLTLTGTAAIDGTGNDLDNRITGNSAVNTLTGGKGEDRLEGLGGNDIIDGGEDDDFIAGGAGADDLDGGDGDGDTVSYFTDTKGVTVDLSTNTVSGAAGSEALGDTVKNFENADGGNGADRLIGDSGQNSLGGDDGNDTLIGGGNGDSLDGGDGNDLLIGGAGSDDLVGGDGIDTASYEGATAGVTADLNGILTADGDAGGDIFIDIENLTGGDGNDTLIGDGKANVLNGGAGNDTVTGGAGKDVMDGGADVDTVDFSAVDKNFSITVTLGAANVQTTVTGTAGSDAVGDKLKNFENVTGGDGNDKITGNADGNVLLGGDGNDVLQGMAGTDVLSGGAGNDTLDGGADLDFGSFELSATAITVNLAAGTITGSSEGNDKLMSLELIRGSDQNDIFNATGFSSASANKGSSDTFNAFEGGGGDDTITGNGNTRISYENAGIGVTVTLDASGNGTVVGGHVSVGTDTFTGVVDIRGGEFNDTLTGNGAGNSLDGRGGDDTINGNSGDDTLRGRAGNDVLNGGVDNDTLIGDDGNDFLIGDVGSDTIDGGAGFDISSYAGATSEVTVDLDGGKVTFTGSANVDTLLSVESIRGGTKGDVFDATGFSGSSTNAGSNGTFNQFEGIGGNDTVTGNGDTRVSYESGTAAVIVTLDNDASGKGTATGDASVGTDTFTGGVNHIRGSQFTDTMTGNTNDNRLEGRLGQDLLTGAAGNDQFEFTRLADADNDQIQDFKNSGGEFDTLRFLKSAFGLTSDADGASNGKGGFTLDADYFVSGNDPLATNPGHAQFLFDTDAGGGDTALYFDADGVAGGEQLVATFLNGATITVDDFDLR